MNSDLEYYGQRNLDQKIEKRNLAKTTQNFSKFAKQKSSFDSEQSQLGTEHINSVQIQTQRDEYQNRKTGTLTPAIYEVVYSPPKVMVT